jgi:protoporphyrinogen oxidase
VVLLDADLIELAKKEMGILGLCKPEDVVGGAVVRQEKAYPVYDDGYADNVAAMRDELGSEISDPAPGRPQRYAPL